MEVKMARKKSPSMKLGVVPSHSSMIFPKYRARRETTPSPNPQALIVRIEMRRDDWIPVFAMP